MRIASGFLSTLGIAIPGSIPEQNDADIQIPQLILSTIEPISPNLKISGSGADTVSSVNVGVGVNRTNMGASTGTMVTFSKGLYEIDCFVNARYNYSAAPGSAPHSSLSLYQPDGAQANPLVPFYAISGIQSGQRKLRILFAVDGWNIRLVYGATGVGENLDMMANIQVTKML